MSIAIYFFFSFVSQRLHAAAEVAAVSSSQGKRRVLFRVSVQNIQRLVHDSSSLHLETCNLYGEKTAVSFTREVSVHDGRHASTPWKLTAITCEATTSLPRLADEALLVPASAAVSCTDLLRYSGTPEAQFSVLASRWCERDMRSISASVSAFFNGQSPAHDESISAKLAFALRLQRSVPSRAGTPYTIFHVPSDSGDEGETETGCAVHDRSNELRFKWNGKGRHVQAKIVRCPFRIHSGWFTPGVLDTWKYMDELNGELRCEALAQDFDVLAICATFSDLMQRTESAVIQGASTSMGWLSRQIIRVTDGTSEFALYKDVTELMYGGEPPWCFLHLKCRPLAGNTDDNIPTFQLTSQTPREPGTLAAKVLELTNRLRRNLNTEDISRFHNFRNIVNQNSKNKLVEVSPSAHLLRLSLDSRISFNQLCAEFIRPQENV